MILKVNNVLYQRQRKLSLCNIIYSLFKLKVKEKTYLYSVARNMWLNELRKRSNIPIIVETDEFIVLQEDHLASMVLTEQNQEMAKLIRSLGDQCQEILIYFYFDRFRMKKVADLMGFASEQVAKNKKSKCLKKLKALVQEKRHRFQL